MISAKISNKMEGVKPLPEGSFPTMITPFTPDGAIDWPCLAGLIEWYIANGCTGLFACCLSSEMYNLTEEERLQLAGFVSEKAAGRVSVVGSGTFGGAIEEQAAFVNKMAEKVDAVVVLPCQLCKEGESEQVFKANVTKLLELTKCPLGVYECPAPYWRILSAECLQWVAATGRFIFHKDTCCKTAEIKAKLQALQSNASGNPFRFYNANVETLHFSNQLGGNGFSGISANFYPMLHAYLCKSPSKANANKVQRFISVAEQVVVDNYPASAKVFLGLHDGFEISAHCRKGEYSFNEVQMLHLRHMKGMLEDLCEQLGIAIVAPSRGDAAAAPPPAPATA